MIVPAERVLQQTVQVLLEVFLQFSTDREAQTHVYECYKAGLGDLTVHQSEERLMNINETKKTRRHIICKNYTET